jgi:zinc/manganese transport system substrate-binding protein
LPPWDRHAPRSPQAFSLQFADKIADLRKRSVGVPVTAKLFVYNSGATDPLAERMLKLAKASNIPVVGASETEPSGSTYQAWMMKELVAVDKALSPLTE